MTTEERLLRRVRIAESAMWILADKYIHEGCWDKKDKTATDVVSQCRHAAEAAQDSPRHSTKQRKT